MKPKSLKPWKWKRVSFSLFVFLSSLLSLSLSDSILPNSLALSYLYHLSLSLTIDISHRSRRYGRSVALIAVGGRGIRGPCSFDSLATHQTPVLLSLTRRPWSFDFPEMKFISQYWKNKPSTPLPMLRWMKSPYFALRLFKEFLQITIISLAIPNLNFDFF